MSRAVEQPAASGRTWPRVALLVGFLAFAGAVYTAHGSPATEYELSIYEATPSAVWAGFAVALAMALLVAFLASGTGLRLTALGLAYGVGFAFVALPVIRGYYYYGRGDALTHFGWTRELAFGGLSPFELFYPGIHTTGAQLSALSGYPLRSGLFLSVLAVIVVSLVFIPLAAWRIRPTVDTVVVGGFVALLFLPVNNISTHLHAHPFTQALFVTPLLLYLLFAYLPEDRGPGSGWVSPTGVLLALASTAVVLYHPLQGLLVVLLLAGIAAIQFVARRRRVLGPVANHRSVYGQAGIALAVFLLWTAPKEAFVRTSDVVGSSLVGYVVGDPPVAGERIQTGASSLQAIGGSILELVGKLFLVDIVVAVLAGGVAIVALRRTYDRTDDHDLGVIASYLAIGAIPAAVLLLVLVVANAADLYFRVYAYLILLAGIFAAAGLPEVVRAGSRHRRRIATVAFAGLLVLSMAVVFPSPYVYLPNGHVTEAEADGYRTAFDVVDGDLELHGVRSSPNRFSHAMAGVDASPSYREGVDPGSLTDVQSQYVGPGYLIVSENDRQREVDAYHEHRHAASDFATLSGQPGTSRVLSNGDVEVYHVDDGDG